MQAWCVAVSFALFSIVQFLSPEVGVVASTSNSGITCYLPMIMRPPPYTTRQLPVVKLTDESLECRFCEDPEWSPDGSTIAFLCEGSRLYAMNADGSSITHVFSFADPEDIGVAHPMWSPDGNSIAFHMDDVNEDTGEHIDDQEIFVIGADGSGLSKLTNTSEYVHDTAPAWSPDGSHIVFVRESSSPYRVDIYSMNADGTAQTELASTSETFQFVAWSPDGTKIVFRRDGCLSVMNADGTNPKQLTDACISGYFPVWSPDGSKIAFSREVEMDDELYVVNADGTSPSRLTNTPGYDGLPQWSHDSSKIFFRHVIPEKEGEGSEGRRYQIHVINSDGSNHASLTPHSGSDFDFDLSPDTQKIVMTSSGYDTGSEIYVMDISGLMLR